MNKKAKDLSGGERMKLSFAMLFVSDVNLLILDEPTNYLDIPSVEALEKLLVEYEGTLIFTSHDKTFVDRVANERMYIEGAKIKTYCTCYDKYKDGAKMAIHACESLYLKHGSEQSY